MTTDKKCKYCAILFKQLLTKQLKVRKATLKEVLEFMTKQSRLEIPSVQDNWIKTIRWLEREVEK